MPTINEKKKSQHLKCTGYKPDFNKAQSKPELVENLTAQLKKAQQFLEEMQRVRDEAGIQRTNNIIAQLQKTIQNISGK